MVFFNLIALFVSLYILVKSSDWAIKYTSKLSKSFQISGFVVSFLLVAIISVMPEATIAIIAAIKGDPALGLGTLIGSNITDLTLIFGLIALFSKSGVKVESDVVRREFLYLLLLSFPLLLGVDGNFSRIDGMILIIAGIFFFLTIYKDSKQFTKPYNHQEKQPVFDSMLFLLSSLAILIVSAFFTVKFATDLAHDLKLPSVLIGLIVVGVGACLPELLFSLRAIKKKEHALALGDILGTVMADATIILGIVTLFSPFTFDPRIMVITTSFMVLAGVISMWFVRSGMKLTEKEGVFLIFLYFIFIAMEFLIHLGHL